MRHYFFALLLLLCGPNWVLASTLTVAADPWCPYNCDPNARQPGYVIEVLRAVFPEFSIDYQVVPWSRTLLNTTKGIFDAALSATKETAQKHDLLIGREMIGVANNCVFVLMGNTLHFKKADDLNTINKVGLGAGYNYDNEIGVWLDRPENHAKIDTISGNDITLRNAQRLLLKRVDAVIENENVMLYVLNQEKMTANIASAGCDLSTPAYVAFSKQTPNVLALIRQLDAGMVRLRQSGELNAILQRYGLHDWK